MSPFYQFQEEKLNWNALTRKNNKNSKNTKNMKNRKKWID